MLTHILINTLTQDNTQSVEWLATGVQTKVSRRRDTVQVKVTPHIGQKQSAIGSPVLKGLNS